MVAAGLLCKLRNFFAHGRPDTIPIRDIFADELAKELPKQFHFTLVRIRSLRTPC